MINDNSGHNVGAAESFHPVNGTGQGVEVSAAGSNYSCSVSCGKPYLLVTPMYNSNGSFVAGLADATVDSNAIWPLPHSTRTKIWVPEKDDGSVNRALHLTHPLMSNGIVRIVQLDDSDGVEQQIVG